MSNSTTSGMCANVEGTPCANLASKVCNRCHLVQYCSQGCQRSHCSLHKNDCNSPYQKQSWKPTSKTVSTFAPLLQPKSQNPHAAILTLYLNAVHEIDPNAAMKILQTEMKQVLSYFPSFNPALMQNTNSCDMLKAFEACAYFRDFVALFDKYEKHFNFRGIGEAIGLQVRDENRIVDKWPLRLKRGASK